MKVKEDVSVEKIATAVSEQLKSTVAQEVAWATNAQLHERIERHVREEVQKAIFNLGASAVRGAISKVVNDTVQVIVRVKE